MRSRGSNLTLAIRVGERVCAVPISDVVEIMRPLPIEAWNGAPDVVRGLSIIRGVPIPVVDLGALLGVSSNCVSTRFVAIRAGQRRVALAVDAVLGIREFSPALRTQMPPLLFDACTELVEAIGASDTELFVVLKACSVVPEAIWDTLSQQEG